MQIQIFDTWIDAVLLVDHDRKLLYANNAFAALLDVSLPRLKKNAAVGDLFKLDSPDYWLAGTQPWSGPDILPFREMEFRTPKGKTGRVQAMLAKTQEGVIAILRDVSLEETLQKKYRDEFRQKEEAYQKLEEYNRTLEQRVAERTQQLSEANQKISAMLDSLGQGFFLFGPDGICGDTYSRSCDAILEVIPSGMSIMDVLKIPDDKRSEFSRWRVALFSDLLPVNDLLALGPKVLSHSLGLFIELSYRPMRDASGKVIAILVIATDLTREKVALREAENERAHAQLITRIVRSRNRFQQFLRSTRDLIGQIENEQLLGSKGFSDRDFWYRKFHTLKGDAAMYGLLDIERLAHRAEDHLAKKNIPELAEIAAAMRKALDALTQDLLDVIGKGWDQSERWLELPASKLLQLAQSLNANSATASLGDVVVSEFLSEPIETFFSHYGSMIESIARTLGKAVAPLKINGGSLRVTPELIGNIANEMVHVFRNVIDHGVELPDQRVKLGKPRMAQIELSFQRTLNGSLRITVADDGPGIDPQIIRSRLLSHYPVNSPERERIAQESDQEVIQHVFDAGVSTRDQVTQLSGRGVGLDALKAEAQKFAGKVWVRSTPGKGSEFYVEIPGVWSQQSLLGKKQEVR